MPTVSRETTADTLRVQNVVTKGDYADLAEGEVRRVGHDGQLRWIAVEELSVDMEYQRYNNPERAAFIARELDPEVLGILIGSERYDGTVWLLDGQHRRDGVRIRYGPRAQVLVYVMSNLSLTEEASIFWKSNKFRLQPTATDTFRARLRAGEEVATNIKRITDENGITIRLSPGSLGTRDVFAFATLEALYKNGTLDMVLQIVKAAWPDEKGAYKAKHMNGIDRFLSEWRYYFFRDTSEAAIDRRVKRIIRVLSERTPNDVDARAQFFRNSLQSRASVAFARAIHSFYNHKLSADNVKLPAWGEFDSPYAERMEVPSDAARL